MCQQALIKADTALFRLQHSLHETWLCLVLIRNADDIYTGSRQSVKGSDFVFKIKLNIIWILASC